MSAVRRRSQSRGGLVAIVLQAAQRAAFVLWVRCRCDEDCPCHPKPRAVGGVLLHPVTCVGLRHVVQGRVPSSILHSYPAEDSAEAGTARAKSVSYSEAHLDGLGTRGITVSRSCCEEGRQGGDQPASQRWPGKPLQGRRARPSKTYKPIIE